MKRSVSRVLTTHAGSLPRPPVLLAALRAQRAGTLLDTDVLERHLSEAVEDVVRRQVACGIDVVSDGEASKPSYATYAADRLTGFDEPGRFPSARDLEEYPDYARRQMSDRAIVSLWVPACTGPVRYRGEGDLRRDIANFKAALGGKKLEEAFMTAASPGVIALFHENRHYHTHEQYVAALADAMRTEYRAIVEAGFVLQVDCPDLAMGQHVGLSHGGFAEFRKTAALHVEALNHALAGLPPQQLRMHVCWANYEGPHHRDVPLEDIVDTLLRARPLAISFTAANPRHEHEWRVWEARRLTHDKILIPGVIDSTTNFIEHPELVAERILRFTRFSGSSNVIAGTDCGFATFAASEQIDPLVAWAKLESLARGAQIASAMLAPGSA